ncbi:ABC transporter ATP-binding protein [Aurantimonas sp. VKM B-3413]|uniref:ABC transporter ATP-binding protein n=1 Tax=Aurantimonas sp. VKM B-3413 TaxID=2779401 RepID=UPI001E4CCB77|nr:ABC transporter ATP-binding protein [Aurantimonas sp. VKM B-3413]MCB8838682.1 ABC transporter ATP-binding protein [Aurantimonas sp. VKM B-3413]
MIAAPVLSVDSLAKRFGGVEAVSEVSFSLRAGEILALIGPNGAGKSTTFNLVNGQLAPDRGRVVIAGADTAGLSPRAIFRLGVGRTFQIASVFGSMTVRENVETVLLSHRRQLFSVWRGGRDADGGDADRLLALAGIPALADAPASSLAYGDVKRLELAMALVGEPKLLLMDEPTAGMAPEERTSLMALAAKIARERDIAILFTEHDMDVVFRHADRIMVMDRGRLIVEGPPETIAADPQVRAVYLGEGFSPGPEAGEGSP